MSFLLTPQQIGRRKAAFEANGGTETTYTSGGIDYKSHTFLSSGTFTVTQGEGVVDRMIVAGGGGSVQGGGGAGGMQVLTGQAVAGVGTYAITIGGGGTGGRRQPPIVPANGTNSSTQSFPTGNATMIGGGRGGYAVAPFPGNASGVEAGGVGGSGGGGGDPVAVNAGGAGTSEQGNAGGAGVQSSEAGSGGGGGGKGAVGGNAPNGNIGGDGGAGLNNVFRTGSNIGYAGGGGGSGDAPGNATGGDANGGEASHGGGAARANGQSGVANTGGGCGGVCNFWGAFGNGGSGIVVLRYDINQ